MALLVLAVNWKFLFMFIVEITLCSFVRLNGSLKECYSLFDHQELLEGLVLSLDCFMLVKNTCSHTGISSTIKKKYCTNWNFFFNTARRSIVLIFSLLWRWFYFLVPQIISSKLHFATMMKMWFIACHPILLLFLLSELKIYQRDTKIVY